MIGQFHKKTWRSQMRAVFNDCLHESEAMDFVDLAFDIHEAASWKCVWLYVDKAKSRCQKVDAALYQDQMGP